MSRIKNLIPRGIQTVCRGCPGASQELIKESRVKALETKINVVHV